MKHKTAIMLNAVLACIHNGIMLASKEVIVLLCVYDDMVSLFTEVCPHWEIICYSVAWRICSNDCNVEHDLALSIDMRCHF